MLIIRRVKAQWRTYERKDGKYEPVDNEREADVSISINIEAIARRVGASAVRNKTGRATALRGLITARRD